MVNHNANLQFHYSLVIPHTHERRVLLLPGEAGWRLPHFVPDEKHFAMVGHINWTMRAQLGITVTTLRCLYDDFDHAAQTVWRGYAMDNHSPDWTPPSGAAWLDQAELDTLQLEIPHQRTALEAWFEWLDENPAQRVPWSHPGWFRTAAVWIHTQLKKLGVTPISPIEQVQVWARSCTLRVDTTEGRFYFKAVHPLFAVEPVLTRVLAKRYPDNLPQVVAVDGARGWMLVRDFGGERLDECQDITQWEAALRSFARLQVDMVSHTGSVIAMGCHDRQVDNLTIQLDRLLVDKAALFPGSEADLSAAEYQRLVALAPRLRSMAYALMDFNVPLSLEHGDLWSRHIRVNGEQFVYFDWADSSVTHPFFDLLFLLADSDQHLPNPPETRAWLRDAYLREWTAFEPMERLVQAMAVAEPLAALHHALVVHQVILPAIELRAQWEVGSRVPQYLRLLLKHMDNVP